MRADPVRVAAMLTDHAKALLLVFAPDGTGPEGYFWMRDFPTIFDLSEMRDGNPRLVSGSFCEGEFDLTPLGRAVRAIIATASDAA